MALKTQTSQSSAEQFRSRMQAQIYLIERYRRQQLKQAGRWLSRDEAAREWISLYAASFRLAA